MVDLGILAASMTLVNARRPTWGFSGVEIRRSGAAVGIALKGGAHAFVTQL
jgi:hypothetical protein